MYVVNYAHSKQNMKYNKKWKYMKSILIPSFNPRKLMNIILLRQVF